MGKNFDLSRFEAAYIRAKEKTFKRLSGSDLKKYLR